jgi:hypothetical protein
MRLHGGYFKKETDNKKSDKKESSGPPLQTASVGVRALIEEKIINKRSKQDLKVSELKYLQGFYKTPNPSSMSISTQFFFSSPFN